MYINQTKDVVSKIPPLKTLTLFTTALCNLKCSYCYICKDNTNALKKIDNDILTDWKNGNYITRLKTQFDRRDLNSIDQLSLWGGETLLGMDRFIPYIKDFKEVLPSFNTVDFSTNFVIPSTIEITQELFDELSKVAGNETFQVFYQVSIDGPEELNDRNRGKGVTKQVLENYKRLLNIKIPENIKVGFSTKPTLSVDSFNYFLSEDNIENYYRFFDEEFFQRYLKDNKNKNFSCYLGIPNYAEPYDYTTADGLMLAEIFKKMEQVSIKHNFEGFKGRSLVPYVSRFNIPYNLESPYMRELGGVGCGKIINDVCMVPNNKFAVCHRSLFDSYVDYHNTRIQASEKEAEEFVDKCTFDLDQYKRLRRGLATSYIYTHKTTASHLDAIMNVNAQAGLIDEKYKKKENRYPVINFCKTFSLCLDNNYRLSGSLTVPAYWWIKLLCNGAFDVMLREIKRVN